MSILPCFPAHVHIHITYILHTYAYIHTFIHTYTYIHRHTHTSTHPPYIHTYTYIYTYNHHGHVHWASRQPKHPWTWLSKLKYVSRNSRSRAFMGEKTPPCWIRIDVTWVRLEREHSLPPQQASTRLYTWEHPHPRCKPYTIHIQTCTWDDGWRQTRMIKFMSILPCFPAHVHIHITYIYIHTLHTRAHGMTDGGQS